jgi:hypothetical protein
MSTQETARKMLQIICTAKRLISMELATLDYPEVNHNPLEFASGGIKL